MVLAPCFRAEPRYSRPYRRKPGSTLDDNKRSCRDASISKSVDRRAALSAARATIPGARQRKQLAAEAPGSTKNFRAGTRRTWHEFSVNDRGLLRDGCSPPDTESEMSDRCFIP